MSLGNPFAYPIPNQVVDTSGGEIAAPQWLKFHQYQQAYDEVSDRHDYEDGGASFTIRNDTAPIRWLIIYDGLLEDEAAIFDAHRADAFGEVYGFSLTNPRTGVTYTDVHYDEGFEEDHVLYQTINRRVIHLIKRPA